MYLLAVVLDCCDTLTVERHCQLEPGERWSCTAQHSYCRSWKQTKGRQGSQAAVIANAGSQHEAGAVALWQCTNLNNAATMSGFLLHGKLPHHPRERLAH